MNTRSRQASAGCVAAVLALGIVGCSAIKYDSKPIEQGSAGVLWHSTSYPKPAMSWERSTVAVVIKVDGVENGDPGPMNLSPGRHSIEVRYYRESYFCPPILGCIPFIQASKSFEWVVEAGHSYMPFARRICERDWMGILDTGTPARDDVAYWTSSNFFSQPISDLTRVWAGRLVVAGDDPPATCDTP